MNSTRDEESVWYYILERNVLLSWSADFSNPKWSVYLSKEICKGDNEEVQMEHWKPMNTLMNKKEKTE